MERRIVAVTLLLCSCYITDGELCVDWWDTGEDCENPTGGPVEEVPEINVCDIVAVEMGRQGWETWEARRGALWETVDPRPSVGELLIQPGSPTTMQAETDGVGWRWSWNGTPVISQRANLKPWNLSATDGTFIPITDEDGYLSSETTVPYEAFPWSITTSPTTSYIWSTPNVGLIQYPTMHAPIGNGLFLNWIDISIAAIYDPMDENDRFWITDQEFVGYVANSDAFIAGSALMPPGAGEFAVFDLSQKITWDTHEGWVPLAGICAMREQGLGGDTTAGT